MELVRSNAIENFTNQWLDRKVQQYSARSLFLPAGETPKPIYALWRKQAPPYLKEMRLLQVDDVIEGEKNGLFARFFEEELPNYKVLIPEIPLDADLAILGLGSNGHVAFHEPGIPTDFRFGEVKLHKESAERLGIPAGTKGRTYGVGAFLRCKAILLVVSGKGKKAVFQRMLDKDPSVPATALLGHADVTVVTLGDF